MQSYGQSGRYIELDLIKDLLTTAGTLSWQVYLAEVVQRVCHVEDRGPSRDNEVVLISGGTCDQYAVSQAHEVPGRDRTIIST